jgi:flagellar assembly protein FliH
MSTLSRPAPQPAAPFPYHEVSAGDGVAPLPGIRDSDCAAAALQRAREEGEAQARAVFQRELAEVRADISQTLAAFARQREEYYQRIEGEVVQLALAIARKILHREAQVDPLVLAGVVRVALEKLESHTRTVVHVHPRDIAQWREDFTHTLDAKDLPELVDDPALEPGRCRIETELGSTELGLDMQLKEIERGLMDLLAHRPASSP